MGRDVLQCIAINNVASIKYKNGLLKGDIIILQYIKLCWVRIHVS